MRILMILSLGLMLLGFNFQVLACEHSSNLTSVPEITVNHQQHQQKVVTAGKASVKVQLHSSCCSGMGMICCLAVANHLQVDGSLHLVSEKLFLKSDSYKSHVTLALQRPPCNNLI